MSVPDHVREDLKVRLWEIADQLGWLSLPSSVKSKYYKEWTRDPTIGGILSRFIDQGQIRVYLKDTLVKDYPKDRLSDYSRPFCILEIPLSTESVETYVKPHGRRLKDGRIICWGRADDWKSVLMAIHERTCAAKGARPFSAVLMCSVGRYQEKHVKEMVENAARKLEIQRLVWLDN